MATKKSKEIDKILTQRGNEATEREHEKIRTITLGGHSLVKQKVAMQRELVSLPADPPGSHVSGALQNLKSLTKLSNGIKIGGLGERGKVIYAEEVKKSMICCCPHRWRV
jgi:hypothetical protein